MADAARKLGRPEAAAAIVDDLCAFLGVPADGGAPSDGGGEESAGEGGGERGESTGGAQAGAADLMPFQVQRCAVRRQRVRRAPLRVRTVQQAQVIDITG